jgi:1-hydroxycarotenoid 3,4-desaturase
MHRLAEALATAAAGLGVRFRYGTRVARILRQGGRVTGVQLAGGETLACAACVWNGDPGALAAGLAGEAGAAALPPGAAAPRSLSAHVWAFAARPQGPRAAELAHHNVFFTDDPAAEFGPIGQGRAPERPTLYLCAEDRLTGPGPPPGAGPERFEIILNAPAGLPPTADEAETCRRKTFDRLRRLGLWFDPEPGPACLTTPATLAQDFPGSQGAIYGRSPEGMLAAFRRPPAQTRLPGLILAGGGAHPGAGVPMAALSGRFAAEATLRALTSPKASARTATPGGISTGSATTGRAPSR